MKAKRLQAGTYSFNGYTISLCDELGGWVISESGADGYAYEQPFAGPYETLRDAKEQAAGWPAGVAKTPVEWEGGYLVDFD